MPGIVPKAFWIVTPLMKRKAIGSQRGEVTCPNSHQFPHTRRFLHGPQASPQLPHQEHGLRLRETPDKHFPNGALQNPRNARLSIHSRSQWYSWSTYCKPGPSQSPEVQSWTKADTSLALLLGCQSPRLTDTPEAISKVRHSPARKGCILYPNPELHGTISILKVLVIPGGEQPIYLGLCHLFYKLLCAHSSVSIIPY